MMHRKLTAGKLVAVPFAASSVAGMLAGTVLAASKDKSSNDTLIIDELSLYTAPQPQLRYEEPAAGHVEQGVTTLRKAAEPYTSWCQEASATSLEKVQEAYQTVEPTVNESVQLVKDGYEMLNNPPPTLYPSLGAVGFSGILGLYLAKGYRFRRLVFPTVLMTLSASVFYPQHAAALAMTTKEQLVTWGTQGRAEAEDLWKKLSSILGTSEKKSQKSSKS
ncbi:apolipoprotein O, b [Engraulis encrasicolus]|uniref:apolipoprotein O, b n=1 Tax=Engraulis encrasicolus TaxID=184585 RepID=UPI002FD498B5